MLAVQPHRAEEVAEAVTAAGAEAIPLPPGGPGPTPIEEIDSKMTGAARAAAARTTAVAYTAMRSALHDVSPGVILREFQGPAA